MSSFPATSTLSASIDRVSAHSTNTMKPKITEKSVTYVVSYQRGGLMRTVAFGDLESALRRVEEVSSDKSRATVRLRKQVITVEESDMDCSAMRGGGAVLDNTLPSRISQKLGGAEGRKKIKALEADHKERLNSLRIFLEETCERTLPCAKSWAKEWLHNGQIIPDLLGGAVASKRWMASVLSLHLEGKPLNFGALEGCPPYWETKHGQELLRSLYSEQSRGAKLKRGVDRGPR